MTRSEHTTGAILDAAESLFLARTYAGVTMEEIAQSSRVTKGAIYHHFSSKEELYLRMMERSFARMRSIFSRALSREGGCRQRLRSLTEAFFAQPARQIGLMRLVRRDINSFPPSTRSTLVRTYQAALPDLVEGAVRDGIRSGELAPGDARMLAWNFVAAVEVTLSRRAGEIFPDSASKLEYVLDLFFLGAGARSRPRDKEHDLSRGPWPTDRGQGAEPERPGGASGGAQAAGARAKVPS